MHNKSVRILRRILFLSALLAPLFGRSENLAKLDGWVLHQSGGGVAKLTRNAADDAMTVQIEKAASPFYLIQLNQPLPGAVAEGDLLRLSFRARSATANPMRAVVEHSGPPFFAVLESRLIFSPEWQEYKIEGEASQAFDAGGLSLRLQCGHQTGVIEIASLRMEDLGVSAAAIASRAALEPAAVESRIQKYRTGDLRVEVRDANGKPVPGAAVKIEMTRSAFLFGCNFFGLNPSDDSERQRDYRQRFTNLFNYATLPFYWGSFEPEQGKPNYAKLEAMAAWCDGHGIVTKGHPLVWHEGWPKWAPKDPDAVIPLFRQRVADIIPHFRGSISYWDVLNEANNAADFDNGEGRWIKRDGAPAVVATALGWARAAAGTNHVTLLYNDYNVGSENEQLIAALQKRNSLPDAIGLQSHMHDHVWPLRRVWQTCERFAAFNRPLHFTELTVVSSTIKPKSFDAKRGEWPTTPEGEAMQADYLTKFYSLLFSHPSVQAITWWDFSDFHAWRNAPSGLVREDMSPKPAYEKLHALIREQWWTNADGKTDAAGIFTAHAFHGEYRITATAPDGRHVETTARFAPDSSGPVALRL
jgi:GH35 family endo-1,4-beta-xylanase